MRRRDILIGGVVMGLAGCAGGNGNERGGGMTTPNKLEEFGLQLSTITPLMMSDFEGTLAEVAAVGYRQVEFSALGFLGRTATHVAEQLKLNGLQAPVGRITPKLPADAMQRSSAELAVLFRERSRAEHLVENVAHALEQAAAVEQKVLNLPALMPADYQTLDQVKFNIEQLNAAGELCAEQGVRFGYHNHDWEYQPIDGVVPYDLMLQEIAPEHLSLQLDQYWVVKATGGFAKYFAEHGDRINSVHLKDMDASGDFADVGFGTLDMPAFIRTAKAAGVDYYFVERDRPPQPRQTMQRAYGYLQEMTY